MLDLLAKMHQIDLRPSSKIKTRKRDKK